MTKEQFIEKYKNQAVWCKTEELAKEFLKEASIFGFKWYPEDELTKYSNYNYYNNETCYFVDKFDFTIAYGSLGYAKSCGYEIIEYKPEKQVEPQNLIPFIAEKLGVAIGEEFKIVEKPQENTYKLEYDGLKAKFSYFDYSYSANLDELIIGEYTIKKLPQAPRLSEQEYLILKGLVNKFKYIARDEDLFLCSYRSKPEKEDDSWFDDGYDYYVLEPLENLFQFIKWEDEEPHNIQELLDEYEKFKVDK